ncbi:MAG: hypothetical protein ACLPLZ_11070 [Terracidiphilus sp.]
MTSRLCLLLAMLALMSVAAGVHAQTEAASSAHARYQIYGGYAFLSNSPNGLPGSRQPLSGWDAAIAFPPWRFTRFKVDVSSYRGTNLSAHENLYAILGGWQFTRRFGREAAFIEGLAGDGGLPRYWGPNGAPGETASWVSVVGGGLDTPISRRFAFRVSGGYQWSNFKLINNVVDILPVQTPGLPNNFWRISSGLVWSF